MELSTSNNDPTLTIADIAKRLNMSENFIYRQTLSGTLQCYAIGGTARKCGAIRFSENQYQEYLEAQKKQRPVTATNRSRINPAKCTPKPSTVTYTLNKLLKQKKA